MIEIFTELPVIEKVGKFAIPISATSFHASRGSTKSKLPRNVSGQYGPLQPPQCGYSNVSHAEVHNAVLGKRGTRNSMLFALHLVSTEVVYYTNIRYALDA